jgi:hypothetical protein
MADDKDTAAQLADKLDLSDDKLEDMSQDELQDAAAKLKDLESALDKAEGDAAS